MNIIQFQCLNDNYGYLINDAKSAKTICIDTPDAKKIIEVAKENNLKIDEVWNTHWHPDHAGGNQEIHNEFGAICIGPEEVSKRGFLLHKIIKPKEQISLGENQASVIDLSGHTLGQIGYHFKNDKKIFVGDALFVLGCGRLFEGDAALSYKNLSQFEDFDDECLIYCAHEYSLANAQFCESLGLSNSKLKARIEEIKQLRAKNIKTVPTLLGVEKQTNPFLLADFENLVNDLNQEGKSKAEVFAFIRKAKDNF